MNSRKIPLRSGTPIFLANPYMTWYGKAYKTSSTVCPKMLRLNCRIPCKGLLTKAVAA
jgi:hypothetical protein